MSARPAIEQAKEVYLKWRINRCFEADLAAHLRNGYVYCSPEAFIMAYPTDDSWRITLAAGKGCLALFRKLMPFPRPFVEWHRKGGSAYRRWRIEQLDKLLPKET